MAGYILRLYNDVLAPTSKLPAQLPPGNRSFYVTAGMATIDTPSVSTTLAPNSAFFSSRSVMITGGKEITRLLRYELVAAGTELEQGIVNGDGVTSTHKISAEVDLESGNSYLWRSDRVEIPPSGIAYSHVHQGPGIRCLIEGGFTVKTQGATQKITAGEAWFEAGPEPVRAWAPNDKPGKFVRVMILPRYLSGKSSISYVNAQDKDKPKLQKYQVFIDREIEI
ncbi:MAG: hypothetical protein VYA17_13090 [Pseudomonadota bacterium]|nr:hypothetical protein [Pseudomonadota bacterium]